MIPETSTTLLKDIAGDADNARWPEFVSRYRPMMCDYVKTHFPGLDADELVQQTLIALPNVLPRYRYAPDETGRFHNYLTGILRNKALKLCEKRTRELAMKAALQRGAADPVASTAAEEAAAWREALLEIAMRQLLSDERIPDKSKQIFQRVMVDGLAPEDVAAAGSKPTVVIVPMTEGHLVQPLFPHLKHTKRFYMRPGVRVRVFW